MDPTAFANMMSLIKSLEQKADLPTFLNVVKQLEALGVHVEGSTKVTGFAEMQWSGALMMKDLKLGSVTVQLAVGH